MVKFVDPIDAADRPRIDWLFVGGALALLGGAGLLALHGGRLLSGFEALASRPGLAWDPSGPLQSAALGAVLVAAGISIIAWRRGRSETGRSRLSRFAAWAASGLLLAAAAVILSNVSGAFDSLQIIAHSTTAIRPEDLQAAMTAVELQLNIAWLLTLASTILYTAVHVRRVGTSGRPRAGLAIAISLAAAAFAGGWLFVWGQSHILAALLTSGAARPADLSPALFLSLGGAAAVGFGLGLTAIGIGAVQLLKPWACVGSGG